MIGNLVIHPESETMMIIHREIHDLMEMTDQFPQPSLIQPCLVNPIKDLLEYLACRLALSHAMRIFSF